MGALKEKTISGLVWSFIDSFANQGLAFIIGIILARLLTPEEFGLIGMVAIFIAVSESFIDSGFSQALIRKKDCTDIDFSTAFYFNMGTSIIFFLILFFSAPLISNFFKKIQLTELIRVLSTILLIDGLTIVQRTKLTKKINFKLQTKVSVISTSFAGIVGITLAFTGFGVWSLAGKSISQRMANSALLWTWNRWRPVMAFSKESLKDLFSFGSKLLASGLIDTLFRNIYYLVIGKYFSAQELGYYTRADNFKDLPSKHLNSVISRVSYPVLAQIQNDKIKLKEGYKKIIKSTMLVTFILLAGLAAIAEPMIITLIGEKWNKSIIYLQMLCFVGAMYPLHSLNLNMLKVQGRSDLFLKLEIYKKILAIPTIIIGIIWGIKIMILGMWFNTIVAYYLNSYYSGRLINYPIKEQITDILPSFILALSMGGIVFITGIFIPFASIYKLLIQISIGSILVFLVCELTHIDAYLIVKEIIMKKIIDFKHARE